MTLPIFLELVRIIGVIAATSVITAADLLVFHANSATAGFTYLILVLALATWVRLQDAIAASFISVAAYNFFFLPPVGTFTIAEPDNWVALFAFLITAVTASQLSSNARRKTKEAQERQRELERMYQFSRALILGEEGISLPQVVLKQLRQNFDLHDAYLEQKVSEPAAADKTRMWKNETGGEIVVPVTLGGTSLGSLRLVGSALPSQITIQAIAQLVAIAIERERAQQLSAKLEASRESERLKTTLLDALAHEFKTPLTSIKAATTSLLTSRLDVSDQQELVTVIDEEAERMTRLVTDSIELARIGSAALVLDKENCSAEELLKSTVRIFRTQLDGRKLLVNVAPQLPLVFVDKRLTELAVRQILDNAIKYSLPATPITISAARQGDWVNIEILNQGEGISLDEQKIFDKFYRAPQVRLRVPGTGLGLSITREIIEAQGGRVWFDSKSADEIIFKMSLPSAHE